MTEMDRSNNGRNGRGGGVGCSPLQHDCFPKIVTDPEPGLNDQFNNIYVEVVDESVVDEVFESLNSEYLTGKVEDINVLEEEGGRSSLARR